MQLSRLKRDGSVTNFKNFSFIGVVHYEKKLLDRPTSKSSNDKKTKKCVQIKQPLTFT